MNGKDYASIIGSLRIEKRKNWSFGSPSKKLKFETRVIVGGAAKERGYGGEKKERRRGER